MISRRAVVRGLTWALALAPVVLGPVLACGQPLQFETEPGPAPSDDAASGATDAGPEPTREAAATADADAGPPCADDMAFGPVTELADLGVATSARFTRHGTYAFVSSFATSDASGEDIFEGDYPKGALHYARTVGDVPDEAHPAPMLDPLRLYYETTVAGRRAIVQATRGSDGQNFSAGAVVPIATGDVETREPYALSSGSVLYFTMNPGAVGGRDVYRAERDGAGQWGSGVVGYVSSGLDDGFPVVSDDERAIFFARGGLGLKADIFLATREDKTDAFSGALPVEGVNADAADDRPSWLSPDRCTLVFTSNRSGAYRVYRASRRP